MRKFYSVLICISLVSAPLCLKAGIWDWFENLVTSVTAIWQPVWGKYTEGGKTNINPPLTTFKRGKDIYYSQRILLKSRVQLDENQVQSLKKVYREIFNNTTSSIAYPAKDKELCY